MAQGRNPVNLPVVYFVSAKDAPRHPIKIGRTTAKAFKGRMAQIQTGMPYRMEVLFALPAEPAAELEVHAIYADYRLQGEWFKPCKRLLQTIEELRGLYPNWRQDIAASPQ